MTSALIALIRATVGCASRVCASPGSPSSFCRTCMKPKPHNQELSYMLSTKIYIHIFPSICLPFVFTISVSNLILFSLIRMFVYAPGVLILLIYPCFKFNMCRSVLTNFLILCSGHSCIDIRSIDYWPMFMPAALLLSTNTPFYINSMFGQLTSDRLSTDHCLCLRHCY